MLGWAAISLQSLVSTYLVDIHHDQSAPATAALNLVRGLLGAGGTAIVGPLISSIHAGWTVTVVAGIMFVVRGLVLLQIFSEQDLSRQREQRGPTDIESQVDK